jgi:hypothetical protein
MTMKEKVAAALRRAKDLMNDSGAHWTRFDLRAQRYDPERGGLVEGEFLYCSLGAIYQVSGVPLEKVVAYDEDEGNVYVEKEEFDKLVQEGDVELQTAAVAALAEQIKLSGWETPSWWPLEYANNPSYTVTNWNDSGERKWGDIAEMFEAAAASVEASDG